MKLFKRKKLTPHQEFRKEFAFFGFDLSDMTDEEIDQGINNLSRVVKLSSFTADEFAQASRALFSMN